MSAAAPSINIEGEVLNGRTSGLTQGRTIQYHQPSSKPEGKVGMNIRNCVPYSPACWGGRELNQYLLKAYENT